MDTVRFESPGGPSFGTAGPGRRPDEDVAHREALRLTFSFEGSTVELLLIEPVEMTVPPSLPVTGDPPAAAFWFELQDARRMTLYRRAQRSPLDSSVEVRTGNPETPLAHVDSGRAGGEFTLLVPSLPRARSIALYTWTLPRRPAREAPPPSPTTIARCPLGSAIDPKAIALDTTPPRTVSDALASYDGAAVIRLRAGDNTGEVAETLYRLDDGEEQAGLSVRVDQAGEHTLLFWSVDRAGNAEAPNRVTFTVRSRARRARG